MLRAGFESLEINLLLFKSGTIARFWRVILKISNF